MRIGLDGLPLTSPRTGVGHYTFELARALALIAPEDQFELVAHQPLTDSALHQIEMDCPGNLRAISTRRYRRWWAVGLPLYLKKVSLDLFHGTNYEVPLWNKRRTVLTIHDLSIWLHPDKHEDDLARRARRRLPIMARSAGVIITGTEYVRREICQNLGIGTDRVVVTPYAPRRSFQPMSSDDAHETKRRLGIEDDFILFVGTVEPRKNLLTLVRAFAQILRHTSHRPQLVLAGAKGWLMAEFNLLVSRLDLGDRLRLTGYLSDAELRALYSACKVFVYPSIYEGFGLPPLEAMACGAPVITSSLPVFHETLGDAACFVEAMDVEALARTMVDLLESEERRHALSSSGQARAARFSWEKTAQLTLDVYHQIMSRPELSFRK